MMHPASFLLGLLCGLAAALAAASFKGWRVKLRNPLGEDEKYLLNVARAAGGRLIVREVPDGAGITLLHLREVPDQRRLEKRDQLDRLFNRGLLKRDPSGLTGRYALTVEGWTYVKGLAPLPVQVKRAGNWYNSISKHSRGPRA